MSGFVSTEAARTIYGVVFHEGSGHVDVAVTAELRQRLEQERHEEPQ